MSSFLSIVKMKVKDIWVHSLLIFKSASYDGKVFCIGFNKTGTTSLGRSLEMMGYDNTSFDRKVWRTYYRRGEYDKILKYTAKFDSADDLPWLKEDMIPRLDKEFPNSKFIYLERDEQSWKRSIYNWTFKKTGAYPDMDEKIKEFREHREFVMEYFKDRPAKDFLVLDIRDPQGFKKLGEFLGRSAPMDAFPHFNDTVKLYGK